MEKAIEHPVQVVLALLQSLLIVAGSLATAALLKARGFPDPSLEWHSLPVLVRSWGFVLLLVPFGWTLFSLRNESSRSDPLSRRWSLLTGLLLLGGLVFLFLVSAGLAGGAGTLIRSTGTESSSIDRGVQLHVSGIPVAPGAMPCMSAGPISSSGFGFPFRRTRT